MSTTTTPTVTIYGFGPATNPDRLDPSSFVAKVLAFASYNKIPYTFNGKGKFSPKAGRCPWVKVTFPKESNKPPVIIEDSQRCIVELSKMFNIDMDSHLTAEEKIQSETLRLVVENALYHTLIRSIWVDNKQFIVDNFLLAVPDFAKSLVVGLIRGSMIEMLNTHGNGDLTDEESHQVAANIYREIARVLGNKKFLFSNDKPSTIDCVLSRYVDQVQNDYFTPAAVKEVFKENRNLVAYGKRLQETLFTAEEKKIKMEQGLKSHLEAKAATTKMMMTGLAGVVAVVSVGGYFGVNLLKSYGWI